MYSSLYTYIFFTAVLLFSSNVLFAGTILNPLPKILSDKTDYQQLIENIVIDGQAGGHTVIDPDTITSLVDDQNYFVTGHSNSTSSRISYKIQNYTESDWAEFLRNNPGFLIDQATNPDGSPVYYIKFDSQEIKNFMRSKGISNYRGELTIDACECQKFSEDFVSGGVDGFVTGENGFRLTFSGGASSEIRAISPEDYLEKVLDMDPEEIFSISFLERDKGNILGWVRSNKTIDNKLLTDITSTSIARKTYYVESGSLIPVAGDYAEGEIINFMGTGMTEVWGPDPYSSEPSEINVDELQNYLVDADSEVVKQMEEDIGIEYPGRDVFKIFVDSTSDSKYWDYHVRYYTVGTDRLRLRREVVFFNETNVAFRDNPSSVGILGRILCIKKP